MIIRPILFNTKMTRAILDGRKTCTRRLPNKRVENDYFSYEAWAMSVATGNCKKMTEKQFYEQYPPYKPGDLLYVRETWCGLPVNEAGHMRGHTIYYYMADGELRPEGWRGTWRPSIHMPKEAARIWLKVTDVRVERLQDITEEGALKEGAQGVRCDHVAIGEHGCTDCLGTGWIEPPIVDFIQIWDSTIKKPDIDRYSWQANPWVWVIEFECCEKPEEGHE